jgi:hypothetical protein
MTIVADPHDLAGPERVGGCVRQHAEEGDGAFRTRVDEDMGLGGTLGGVIDHRLAALPRISEPSSATVTLSGSECGSVVTTSPGSAAEAATEEASTAAKQETRRTVAVPQLVAWPTAQT